MLWHLLTLLAPGGTLHPRVSQCLEIVKDSPQECLSCASQLIQSAGPQPPPSRGFYTLGHILVLYLNHPGLGTGQLGIAPMSQSQPKLFQVTMPKPAYSASPVPSCRNQNEGFVRAFPLLFPLPPDWLWCFPVWHLVMCCAPSSWDLWMQQAVFSVVNISGSPALLALPYLDIIKPTF